jgi:hypothetical protein
MLSEQWLVRPDGLLPQYPFDGVWHHLMQFSMGFAVLHAADGTVLAVAVREDGAIDQLRRIPTGTAVAEMSTYQFPISGFRKSAATCFVQSFPCARRIAATARLAALV